MCLGVHLKSEDSHINWKGLYVVVYAVCWATVFISSHTRTGPVTWRFMGRLFRYCMRTKNAEVKLIIQVFYYHFMGLMKINMHGTVLNISGFVKYYDTMCVDHLQCLWHV